MLTFIAFIFVFGILVFVHELGHFLAARRMGVRVEEFGFGFPPRIWSRKKGDTNYSINLIPLGGFVKLYGEHGDHAGEAESYASKTKKQKSLILVSGVLMNFILAFLLLTFAFLIGFKSFIPGMEKNPGVINTQKIKISKVEEKTPASESLKVGDTITKVEGQEVFLDMEVFVKVNEATKNNAEKPIELVIVRDGKEGTKNVKTYSAEVESRGKKVNVRRMGVVLETEGKIQTPFYMAPVAGLTETARLSALTLSGILDFFGKIITRLTISENVVGPAGIVGMVGGAAQAGIIPLLLFMAILSLSLAVINIMPLPALDGGHLAVLAVEKLAGRELSNEAKNKIQFLGFVFLIGLMVLVTIRYITGVGAL